MLNQTSGHAACHMDVPLELYKQFILPRNVSVVPIAKGSWRHAYVPNENKLNEDNGAESLNSVLH